MLGRYRIFVVALLFYIVGASLYIFYSFSVAQSKSLKDIDHNLYVGANATYAILGESFFMRATDKDSISSDEDKLNIKKLTAFNDNGSYAFLYASMMVDGKVYLIASSASQEELENGVEVRYFYHYDSASEMLRKALSTGEPQVGNYSDEWGLFRAIFIPRNITSNKRVVVSSEIDITYLNELYKKQVVHSIFESSIFMVLLLPMIIAFLYLFRDEYNRLKNIVQRRTEVLKKRTTELEKSLEEIKTLKGIVPICANCKKIRDDKGYWNLLLKNTLKHLSAMECVLNALMNYTAKKIGTLK